MPDYFWYLYIFLFGIDHPLFHQYMFGHYLIIMSYFNMYYSFPPLILQYYYPYYNILKFLLWCAIYLLFIINVYCLYNCRHYILINKIYLYYQSIYFLSNLSLFIITFIYFKDSFFVGCKASGSGYRKYW